MSPAVLVVTADPVLLDHVLRIAAAAGCDVEVGSDVARVRRAWGRSALVVVGIDLVESLVRVAPPRRPGVVVAGRDEIPARAWQDAVALGVDRVVELPADERWLADRLADIEEGPSQEGAVIGVVGARGGAGASTVAAGMALAAAARGRRSLLVDGDPLSGGIDVLLGGEEAPGLRWPDLVGTRGRIARSALERAVPVVGGVGVVSWDRGSMRDLPVEAALSVLDAGRRGFDLCVVDLPRWPGPLQQAVLPRCAAVLLVVPADVRSLVAASLAQHDLSSECARVLAVRRDVDGSRIDDDLLTEVLGLPVVGSIPCDPRLTSAVDDGDGLAGLAGRAIGRALAEVVEAVERACASPGAAA